MNEGDVLICKKQYDDGTVLVEHRDERGFLIGTYIGYYRSGGVYQLYPVKGIHREIPLAGKKISAHVLR